MEKYSGRHLIIDGRSVSEKLTSLESVTEYIEKSSKLLNMTLVFPPIVTKLPFSSYELQSMVNKLIQSDSSLSTNDVLVEYINYLKMKEQNEVGITGVGIWLESHISVHTWPEQQFLSIDVFSCREYDYEKQIQFTTEYFQLQKYTVVVIDRYVERTNVLYQNTVSNSVD